MVNWVLRNVYTLLESSVIFLSSHVRRKRNSSRLPATTKSSWACSRSTWRRSTRPLRGNTTACSSRSARKNAASSTRPRADRDSAAAVVRTLQPFVYSSHRSALSVRRVKLCITAAFVWVLLAFVYSSLQRFKRYKVQKCCSICMNAVIVCIL